MAAELDNDCYHIDDYDLYVDPPVETEEEESLSEEESDVDTDDVVDSTDGESQTGDESFIVSDASEEF